jgi:Tfp pilus assembly protein PilZ
MTAANSFNQRQHERFSLTPMYTAVTVTAPDGEVFEGHAYDISIGGARLEIDRALLIGDEVSVAFELPGWPEPVHASGPVVWVNDDQDDPGPRRMALRFTAFASGADLKRLVRYVGSGMVYRAA